jgi:lipoprotein-releasing system permease protein
LKTIRIIPLIHQTKALNFLFAWRYFRSKKNTNAINIIAWISIVAIAVVVASLIIVFSVFNGFEDMVKSMYKDFYADISIKPSKGKVITLSPQQKQIITSFNELATTSFSVEEKAFLVNGEYTTVTFLKGVDENYTQLNGIATSNHLIDGIFAIGNTEQPNLVMGSGVQNAIGANIAMGNSITMYLPNKTATQIVAGIEGMNSYNAIATGVFTVQQEFDNKYAFTNIGFMQYMLNLQPNQYTQIEAKLKNNNQAEAVSKKLQTVLGNQFLVETRYQQNKSLYVAMQLEKWIIYGVTCLILLIAAFNIIGALTMLVLEKQKDIAVLKAMGASNSLIKKIFLTEGMLLCFIGATAGLLIATFICVVQIVFKVIPLTGQSFLINYYPVQLQVLDYVVVVFTVSLIAMIAAYFPAKNAAIMPLNLKS